MQGTGGYVEEGPRAGLALAESVPLNVVRCHYQCAAVSSDETKFLYEVKKGQRVLNVSLRQGVSAAGGSTATWSVGDAANNAGYLAATTCVQTAGTIIDGAGPYCTNQGKLQTALTKVNLYYLNGGGAGATAPSCDVRITVQQEWPEV